MKIYIHSLGCKVNQYEAQAMETLLTQRGHEILYTPEGSDCVVINSCAVTAESVRKSRQTVRHLKSECPDALVAICGCWSQTDPDSARSLCPDVLFGSGDREALVDAIEKAHESRTENVGNAMGRRVFEILPPGSSADRTRALLKIEDGCVNFCSYCIIPYARGPVRSLPIENCASQARELMDAGYREIILTGIEIASYGKDLEGKPTLCDAVCAIAEAAPTCRIRLGSLEPRCITEEFCEKVSEYANLCPHFHLSLQSGCDKTLAAMNRKYDTARFYKSVTLLRRYFPNCGITADLITGFPGETEEDFSETLSFIEKCAFSSTHIFPYSVREGTRAAKMDCQVEKAVKHRRAKMAAVIAEKSRGDFLKAQVGKTLSVLFEQEEDGVWSGHAPNYVLVHAKGENLHNLVTNVLITAAENGSLWGEVIL